MSGPATPPAYTSVLMIEKRVNPATLCHFGAFPTPFKSARPEFTRHFRITSSGVTKCVPRLPKAEWHEVPTNAAHFRRLSVHYV